MTICYDVRHSRKATAVERDADTRKRIDALRENRRTMSPEQYRDRMEELESGTFVGYPRCTIHANGSSDV